jgi:hypothetical protein
MNKPVDIRPVEIHANCIDILIGNYQIPIRMPTSYQKRIDITAQFARVSNEKIISSVNINDEVNDENCQNILDNLCT